MKSVNFRTQATAKDVEHVKEIVSSSGFFYDHEIDVAVELVQERLNKGESSGYHFVFAETEDRTVGYACFGPIACTVGSFDLYWIAVHKAFRDRKIGKALLAESEREMARLGCRAIYVETASREQYLPTREFYLRTGYRIEAVLKDFYSPGDDKVIFVKRLEGK